MNKNKLSPKLLAVTLLIGIALSGCAETAPSQNDPQLESVKFTSFRDIPGVTEDETVAVESFQRQGVTFIYGTMPSTETFYDENGGISGFTALLGDWLSELFGIPFEIKLYEWDDMP
jgi:hypothetical protein